MIRAHPYYKKSYMKATKSDQKRTSLSDYKYNGKYSYLAKQAFSNMASVRIFSQDLDSSSDEVSHRKINKEIVSPKPALNFDVAKFHRELKYVKLEGESYNEICSFYNDIQSAIGVATENPHTLPDIEMFTPLFCFDKYIIPPKSSAMYIQGQNWYSSISRALKKKIMHCNLISTDCTKLINKRNTHSHENDGFKLLLKLLSTILPHLGGQSLDIVDETAQIKVDKGDNLNSL